MKFYNPFKPHIVMANDEYFYIRAYFLFDGFKYLSYDFLWMLKSSIYLTDCKRYSYVEALSHLNNFKEFHQNKQKPFKVIKVLNDA